MNDTQRRKQQRPACFAAIGLVAALLQLAVGVSPVRASMDLVLYDAPDIHFGNTSLSYDHPNNPDDLLKAVGWAITLQVNADTTYDIIYHPNYPQYPGPFLLEATIDASGKLQPGADNKVRFSGYVPALGYNSGTILTGNITAFSSGGPDDVLQFLFDVTGGDAASLFGGIGIRAGLILAAANFPGSFSAPFANSGAFGDAGNVVPEAASILIWPLLGIAALGIEWRRRRRSCT